jgi:NitT/TauT family transport system ATP-binding protein
MTEIAGAERNSRLPTADRSHRAENAPPAVVLDGVYKHFRTPEGHNLTVLDGCDLSVGEHEFVSIVGPSGCGKTTILRILAGLERQSDGSVLVEGAEPGSGATGFVFQKSALFPWRTVRRNVAFSVDLAAARQSDPRLKDPAIRRERVDSLLKLVELTEFAGYYPHQISGGMQQRVNLARGLAIEPPVLLMDEPFSALDAQTREKLQRDLLGVLASVGTTTVFITHDIREAVFLADRVVLMSPRPGRVLETYTVNEPRPRSVEFQQSDAVTEMTRIIWQRLHENETTE